MLFNTIFDFLFGIVALTTGSYFWFVFMRKRDRLEPEPIHALIRVLLVGGLLSAVAAVVGNQTLNAITNEGFGAVLDSDGKASTLNVFSIFIFSALVEEICKYSAAYWLIRKHKEVNEPVDGLIYAVAVGLGFSFFENILYLFMHGGAVTLIRLFLAVPLHMATAAIWGIYFATTLASNRPLIYLNAMPQVLLAVALHAAWNSSASLLGGFFIILTPFILRYCLKRVDVIIDQLHEYSPFHPNNTQGEMAALPSKNESVINFAPGSYAVFDGADSKSVDEMQKSGDKRHLNVSWFDIFFSVIFPIWGYLRGALALAKGEKRKGFTMIAIGFVGVVLAIFLEVYLENS